MKTPDPYEALGVPRDATAATIKAAYRKRAKAAHPDKRGGSDDELKAVNQAWEILGDPEKRARYDATGEVAGAESTVSMGERVFLEVLEKTILEIGEEPLSLTAEMECRLKRGHKKITEQIDEWERGILALTKHLDRYTLIDPGTADFNKGENFLESRLRARLAFLQRQVAEMIEGRKAIEEARAICLHHVDSRPPKEPRIRRVTIPRWAFEDFVEGTTRP